MLKNGYLHIGTWRRIPIRVHWSTPVGMLLFGRFQFVPAFWLAFLLIVLLHEMGHAYVVRRVGAKVHSIDVLAIGGLCHWSGDVSPIARACIAWGGVWAQMILLAGTYLALAVHGWPTTLEMAQLAAAFTTTNIWMILFNLFPVRPLDGAEAWALFPLLKNRWQQRRAVARSVNARLAGLMHLHEDDGLEARLGEPAADVKATVGKLLADLKAENAKR